MFDWRGGRRPCYWSQTTWPTTFFRLVSFSCLASSSSWNISPPPDLRLSFLARDFSLSSWARPSSECWWMQVLGRSRWRMAVVLLINTLTLSLSLSLSPCLTGFLLGQTHWESWTIWLHSDISVGLQNWEISQHPHPRHPEHQHHRYLGSSPRSEGLTSPSVRPFTGELLR